MLTFQFALDEKDCAAYVEASTLETLSLQPKKNYAAVFIIVGIVLLYVFISEYSAGKFPSASFIGLAVFFAFIIFLTRPRKNKMNFAYKQSSATQVKVFVNNPDNQSFFNSKTYTVSDTGIEISSAIAALRFTWPAFVKRKDTATHIFLFTDQVSIITFPKNKITALAEFESILAKHISFHAEVGREIK